MNTAVTNLTTETVSTPDPSTAGLSRRNLTLKNKFKTTLLIGGVMMAVSGAASAANILENGGFEFPDIPSGSFDVVAVPGWTASNCGIEIQDHIAGSPFEGEQHVELDSFCSSSMYQDISGAAGTVYRLSYQYSPRPRVANNSIEVMWDGVSLGVLNTSGAGNADTVWEQHTHLVQASTTTTRLQFTDVGTSNTVGGYIDDVILEPLNAPPTSCEAQALTCDLIKDLVSHRGIANALCAKLNAILAAIERGNETAEARAKGVFARLVNAQTGRHISSEDAALLIGAVNEL